MEKENPVGLAEGDGETVLVVGRGVGLVLDGGLVQRIAANGARVRANVPRPARWNDFVSVSTGFESSGIWLLRHVGLETHRMRDTIRECDTRSNGHDAISETPLSPERGARAKGGPQSHSRKHPPFETEEKDKLFGCAHGRAPHADGVPLFDLEPRRQSACVSRTTRFQFSIWTWESFERTRAQVCVGSFQKHARSCSPRTLSLRHTLKKQRNCRLSGCAVFLLRGATGTRSVRHCGMEPDRHTRE